VARGQRPADLPTHPDRLPVDDPDQDQTGLGAKPLQKLDARTLDAFYDALRRRGNAKAARAARARAQAAAEVARVDPAPVVAAPTAEEQRLSASRVHDAHVIIAGECHAADRRAGHPCTAS
jgi:hypothetical protein